MSQSRDAPSHPKAEHINTATPPAPTIYVEPSVGRCWRGVADFGTYGRLSCEDVSPLGAYTRVATAAARIVDGQHLTISDHDRHILNTLTRFDCRRIEEITSVASGCRTPLCVHRIRIAVDRLRRLGLVEVIASRFVPTDAGKMIVGQTRGRAHART